MKELKYINRVLQDLKHLEPEERRFALIWLLGGEPSEIDTTTDETWLRIEEWLDSLLCEYITEEGQLGEFWEIPPKQTQKIVESLSTPA